MEDAATASAASASLGHAPATSAASAPASAEALLAVIEEGKSKEPTGENSLAPFALGTGENSETRGRRLRLTFSKQKGWKMV